MKEKIKKTKQAVKDFQALVIQNWFAIEIEKKKPTPDQKKIDAALFNIKDTEQHIAWTKEIQKSLESSE